MSGDEVKRMWVGGQLDEVIHTSLLRVATKMGRHPSNVVELAVETYIVNYVRERVDKGEEIDDKILVTALAIENRERENQISQLKQIAYSHMRTPTEEGAERLESACNAAGIPVEILMEEINDNEHIRELIAENGSMTNAELWLMEHMEPGKRYPMRDIVKLGEQSGFKEWALKTAKINIGVESKRESQMWVWIMPEKIQRPTKPGTPDEVVF